MPYIRMQTGFTLAELLVALLILGEIATFTIPKVLQSQQDTTYKSGAKETAATLAGAFQSLQLAGGLSSGTGVGDLTSYMNYVKVYTGALDDTYTDTTISCAGGTYTCFILHNGGAVAYRNSATFGGTASTNGLPFFFDPDAKVTDGTTNGPGKSIVFFIFYNGRISDRGSIPAGTTNSITSYGAAPSKMPPWFSWD